MHRKINITHISLLCALILFGLVLQGCAREFGDSEKETQAKSEVPEVTKSSAVTLTSVFIPTRGIDETLEYENLRKTTTPTPTPTLPPGIFAIQFYPPLTLNYDPQVWEDKSEYYNPKGMVNFLNARGLSSCKIRPLDPSGFYPSTEPV